MTIQHLPALVLPESARFVFQLTTELFSLRPDASRNRTLPGGQRWTLAPRYASKNRTLLGWQRWMLAHGMLPEPNVARLACSSHGMLLDTGRYQVGSDGCSPHAMLLETERSF